MTTGGGRLGAAVSRTWYAPPRGWLGRVGSGLVVPLSWVYGLGAGLRGAAYDWGWATGRRAPVPVISVGNLTAGGAGKTPVVLELVRRLVSAGHRPAVLSRGYGARRRDARQVADAEGLLLDAAEGGDEPVLLARRAPGVAVFAGPDRVRLAELAAGQGATVAVLDDGLQHRRLARDLDVVVVDAAVGLGNGRLLPAGPLREPAGALGRAGLLWLTRVDEPPATAWIERLTRLAEARGLPVVRSRYRPERLVAVGGGEVWDATALAGRPVVALAGLARPESFLRTLEAQGAVVVGRHLFPDHHPFGPAELARARAEARAAGAWVVTTEKDAVRLPPGAEEVRVLPVDVVLESGAETLDAVLARVAPAPPRAG